MKARMQRKYVQQKYRMSALKAGKMLGAAVAAALSSMAYGEAAGRIDFAVGGVQISDASGTVRAAKKGEIFYSGDRVSTGKGRIQLRFTDGGYMSLMPGSVFSVDNYALEGKSPTDARAQFSLLKGGLRTITGSIGHVNREAYRLKTPVATIGIRGTEYVVSHTDAGLIVSVGGGAVALHNDSGQLMIHAGQSAFVAPEEGARPKQTMHKPFLRPPPAIAVEHLKRLDPLGEDQFHEIRDLFEILPGAKVVAVGQYLDGITPDRDLTVVMLNGNLLRAYVPSGTIDWEALTDNASLSTGSGTDLGALRHDRGSYQFESGLAGIPGLGSGIAWSRWSNGSGTVAGSPADLGADKFVHLVAGLPTLTMPERMVASYALMGGTTATGTVTTQGTNGGTSPLLAKLYGGGLKADFGLGQVDLSLQLALSTGGHYSLTAKEKVITGNSFDFSLYSSGNQGEVTSDAGGCGYSCSGNINGFFAGPGAVYAGLVYTLDDSGTTSSSSLTGAAGFMNSSLLNNKAMAQAHLLGRGAASLDLFYNALTPLRLTFDQSGDDGLDYAVQQSGTTVTPKFKRGIDSKAPMVDASKTGLLSDSSGKLLLAWGSFAQGELVLDGQATSLTPVGGVAGWHYVAGLANPVTGLTGTASYSLKGSALTDNNSGKWSLGSDSTLTANFDAAQIGYQANVIKDGGGAVYSGVAPSGSLTLATDGTFTGNVQFCAGCTAPSTISGFIGGSLQGGVPGAEVAGVALTLVDDTQTVGQSPLTLKGVGAYVRASLGGQVQ